MIVSHEVAVRISETYGFKALQEFKEMRKWFGVSISLNSAREVFRQGETVSGLSNSSMFGALPPIPPGGIIAELKKWSDEVRQDAQKRMHERLTKVHDARNLDELLGAMGRKSVPLPARVYLHKPTGIRYLVAASDGQHVELAPISGPCRYATEEALAKSEVWAKQ